MFSYLDATLPFRLARLHKRFQCAAVDEALLRSHGNDIHLQANARTHARTHTHTHHHTQMHVEASQVASGLRPFLCI